MWTLAVFAALTVVATAQTYTYSTGEVTITSSAVLVPTSVSGSGNVTTSTSGPTTYTIAVGKGGNLFSPDVTVAEVGDTIEFQFYPTNHSVIRAQYGYACVPYEMVLGAGHYGFFSGFEPVDVILDSPPKWHVRINDSDPVFFYCGAPGSCIGYGMVGVINPNASENLQHQRQLAEASTFMLVPGEDWPNEGSIPSGVASSSTTAPPTATSAAATVTATALPSHGMGAGTIAGIAIGGAAVLLAAGVAVWFCGRQSRKNQTAPLAPAQEIHPEYSRAMSPMYSKPGHVSAVSGYTMPPNYDQHGVRSPTMSIIHSPVDPRMGQQAPLMHSDTVNFSLQPTAPAYRQSYATNSIYAVGTHNVMPVEIAATGASPARRSTEKPGVERYY